MTKLHKTSLNCLLVREQQLFVQEIGMLSLSAGDVAQADLVPRLRLDRVSQGLNRGTHEIEL